MSDDFVTRLQVQLREAATREARRRTLGRATATARSQVAARPLLAGAVLVGLLALAIILAIRPATPPVTPPNETVPAGHALKLVTSSPLLDTGGVIASGFGAVWASDNATGDVLRIDPATRRVLARVPVGGEAYVAAGAGAVWATARDRLLRIDPGTNRVTARIPLKVGDGFFTAVFATRSAVWVPTIFELMRVDPERDTLVRHERTSLQWSGFATAGKMVYSVRSDGLLVGLDATTGARVSTSRIDFKGFLMAATGDAAVIAADGGIVTVDPRTGRMRWRASLDAGRVNEAIIGGDSLWLHITDAGTNRDRLVRLEVRTGRETGALTLPEFGVERMALVGRDVWVVTTAGHVLIAR